MKKTLIRLICLIMTAVMVFALAGCGEETKKTIDDSTENFDIEDDNASGGNTDTPAGDATGNNQGGVTVAPVANADTLTWKQLVTQIPAELKGTTVKIYNWNPIKEYPGAEKVIKDFENQTGIKVEWVTGGYDDYDSKIAAMVNAGDAPDLIRMYSPDIHRMYLCQDVKTATGFDFTGDIWDNRVTSEYTVNGKIYAVNLKNTYFNQPKVMMYRRSIIDKMKLEDPYALWKGGNWTWDKFIDMCKQYKELNPTGYPWMSYNAVDLMNFMGQDFIALENGKYVNKINDNAIYQSLQKMCNYASTEILSSALRQTSYFEQGNVLFMTFNSIANRRTNANLTNVKSDDDLFCVPVPAIPGVGDVQLFQELEAYGIPKGAKNAPAAYYFLRYFLDASNYDANTFFCNKQALDVYTSCMSKGDFFINNDGQLLDAVSDAGGNMGGLSDFIRNGGAVAQLKKELDAIKPTFDLATKKANEVLAKFK